MILSKHASACLYDTLEIRDIMAGLQEHKRLWAHAGAHNWHTDTDKPLSSPPLMLLAAP